MPSRAAVFAVSPEPTALGNTPADRVAEPSSTADDGLEHGCRVCLRALYGSHLARRRLLSSGLATVMSW